MQFLRQKFHVCTPVYHVPLNHYRITDNVIRLFLQSVVVLSKISADQPNQSHQCSIPKEVWIYV